MKVDSFYDFNQSMYSFIEMNKSLMVNEVLKTYINLWISQCIDY